MLTFKRQINLFVGQIGRGTALALCLCAGVLLGACAAQLREQAGSSPPKAFPPHAEFQELCNSRAGIRAYNEPVHVDGFVMMPEVGFDNGPDQPATDYGWGGCFPCLYYLVGLGYSYVEAPFRLPTTIISPTTADYAEQTGLYRYRIARRQGKVCDRFDFMAKYSRHRNNIQNEIQRYNFHSEDSCVVAERIDRLTARYQLQSSSIFFKRTEYLGRPATITEGRLAVTDRTNDSLLAESEFFFFRNAEYRRHHKSYCPVVPQSFDLSKYLVPRAKHR